MRVGLHWLVLSLGEGLVFVCLSLARLTLGSDFLSEHFTFLCADEPGVERTILEQVDDDNVEEYDWTDLSQPADNII